MYIVIVAFLFGLLLATVVFRLKSHDQKETWRNPAADELYKQTWTKDDRQLDQKLRADLSIKNPDSIVTLFAKKDTFYLFDIHSPTGGGFAILVRMHDGYFEELWRGQDFQDCPLLEQYNVSKELAPTCFRENRIIDRWRE